MGTAKQTNTFAEENYLKAIYALKGSGKGVSTNAIAKRLNTKAASVTDMIRRLSDKDLVHYRKYRGVSLTGPGEKVALKIIRKHRLWEVFLVEKLRFKWDEVHDIAEQLEHIVSPELTNRLEKFLSFPRFDPHGDPIPDKNGQIIGKRETLLSDFRAGDRAVIVGVRESSAAFLKYLGEKNLVLGIEVLVKNVFEYDNSYELYIGLKNKAITLPYSAAMNLFVKKKK